MKHLTTILIVTISIPFFCQGQEKFPLDDQGKVVYTEVVPAEGLSKEEIYEKAKFWIVSTLKSGDNMVELSGDNSDQIVGTGNLSLGNVKTGWTKSNEISNTSLNFKFIVFCKDGRFKYEVSNILLEYVWSSYPVTQKERCSLTDLAIPKYINGEKVRAKFKLNIETVTSEAFTQMISDFLKSMQESNDDDW